MLFKLVVITVLVIAESADNCIKTVLRPSTIVFNSHLSEFYLKLCRLHHFGLIFFLVWITLDFKMLRNCKVARVLPRIADCAKNDKNAVLRARFAIYLA